MRRIEAEVREEAPDRDGDQVTIFLEGIDQLDENASIYLRPLDAIGRGDDLGTLANDLQPVAVRAVAGGVELVLGSDVTGNPALEAGCPVEIEIPDAGVWSELTWPALRQPPRARRPGGAVPGNRPKVAKSVAEPTSVAPSTAAASGTKFNIDDAALTRLTSEPNIFAQQETAPMSVQQPLPESGSRNPGDDNRNVPGQEYVVFYPHARGGKLGSSARDGKSARRHGSLLPSSRLGAAAMAAAAVLGVQALFWSAGGSAPVPTGSPSATISSATAEAPLYDLFAVGPVSPRGVQAANVNSNRALDNAQAALLTPGAPRDSDEGAYWLRRFMATGGADERTRRVLTQLGTALADSTNRPADYGRARQVWELASAFGDSVAMCFLGTLHENGYGAPADRRTALLWFERAKQAGGCPSVDASIARLKK